MISSSPSHNNLPRLAEDLRQSAARIVKSYIPQVFPGELAGDWFAEQKGLEIRYGRSYLRDDIPGLVAPFHEVAIARPGKSEIRFQVQSDGGVNVRVGEQIFLSTITATPLDLREKEALLKAANPLLRVIEDTLSEALKKKDEQIFVARPDRGEEIVTQRAALQQVFKRMIQQGQFDFKFRLDLLKSLSDSL